MKYDYDLICIGLGPAGMAVSIMGSEMGLKVCAIEKHKIGGECMNCGCIPSKAILRIAEIRNNYNLLTKLELSDVPPPSPLKPFAKIQQDITYINEKKTVKMFDKVDLKLQEGAASFVDNHTVEVNGQQISAKRIYIATGTKPTILPIPGIDKLDILTNENIFKLNEIPKSLAVLGGGAIACEMAQAFSRLGSQVTLIQRSEHLLSKQDKDAAIILENALKEEGLQVLTGRLVSKIENQNNMALITTDKGDTIECERVLAATGRTMAFDDLKLENAGIRYDNKGIKVNKYLQTSQSNIYAIGDCNGYYQFSHAAMHQGMIALMNAMTPWPLKKNFKKFVVPSTMFTDPQVSQVGMTEKELQVKSINYETHTCKYEDYGAAIAEELKTGFVKAFTSPLGHIYGAVIVGAGSGEMINEWALAIQKKIRIHDIMMLQHSFPTMGFLTKRVAETWMMNKMKSEKLKSLCRFMW